MAAQSNISGGSGGPSKPSELSKRLDLDGHDLPPSPAPSSPRNGRRRYALATELVYTETNDQYGSSSIPIYQSATFKQSSARGGNSEYDYTRSGNPTRTHLERHMAKIMNASRALAVGSGMGALDVITRLLRPGDEVITGDDLYGGTNRLLAYLSSNQGIVVHHVNTTTVDAVRDVVSDKTAMYGSSSIPIYQSATFKQSSARGGNSEYDYTRSGNPTRTHLERHMAKIMNASRALAVGSGMGALDVITRLLRPGDEVITGDDLYGGTNRLLAYLSSNQGIVVHHVNTTTVDAVRDVVSDKTAMVLLETPTNPLIKVIDIPSIARVVHEVNDKALVVVDNTMLSPMLCNPLDLGADIVYESGTKYLSGHHDIMAGIIGVNDAAVADKLYFTINASGCGLSPNDSFLLMRGVKTLAIRMEKQQSNAQQIAEFLENHGFRVRYPGLKSHPQYDLHWSMARGAGAVLSFETGDASLSERIVEAARLWGISVSFGCVNSLISMPCQMSHASIDAKTRKERQMPEDIIRLCVGIEDFEDLIDDLSRALVQAGAVTVTLEGIQANPVAA
ncbi:hypothetical protein BN1708_001128 [Verticillium longisporum]|uniref:Cystathionine beta-lyase n=1 Tax=Verticillium longisporum TaxID=100787 RepID=A0A0G4MHG4_VERLO|nr:hypothetical protein BN1708_001128 [Verticillium longisporum]